MKRSTTFLHERQTMSVATFNHDQTIHLVAMWYGFYEGKPAFETFTKSQKILNLRRDDRDLGDGRRRRHVREAARGRDRGPR